MDVALINTNRIRPPIAPIGLDYLSETLHAAGHRVQLLDLCWAENVSRAISVFFSAASFDLVGMSVRNTDDCAYTTRQSFVAEAASMAAQIRRHSDAFLLMGGVGFSVMPELVLSYIEHEHGAIVDAGIWGEGEFALVELLARLQERADWRDIPGMVWRRQGAWQRNRAPQATGSAACPPLSELPSMSRTWVDNARYFRWGGQAGIETKRGCPGWCTYCADPLAKGPHTRLRPPSAVVDELECLLGQGIDHIHTCDSEFNLPPAHALEICQEIVRRRLGDKLRWYAYCAPAPFTRELCEAMRAAGCVGINFGADHGDVGMLRRLGRAHAPEDVVRATQLCHEVGIAVMLDLLLGSPGETRQSLQQAIECMNQAAPDRVGISAGLRVYPGTTLAQCVAKSSSEPGLSGGPEPAQPRFYLEPAVAPFCFSLLDDLVGGDRRFLFFDPAKPERNYNYNANQRLSDAIAEGYRGAYWDILRRM
jgi:radical SAM superfamily enzyme YgiQ (UPF0313 family)